MITAGILAVLALSAQEFPLGSLGGKAENKPKEAHLVVRSLIDGAPGQAAGLRVGDRITGVNGTPFGPAEENSAAFGKGPLESLGFALDKAEGGDAKLVLNVQREQKSIEIKPSVPRIGSYGPRYPFDCAKSKAWYDELCRRLAADQGGDGSWGGGPVTSAYSGLALLARRDGKYAANVKRLALGLIDRTTSRASFDRGGCSNWGIAYSGIFLAEYYWATRDPKTLAPLKLIVEELVSRQRPEGLYGHSEQPVYGGNGLTVVGSAVLWCFAAAEKCGIAAPESTVSRLIDYLRTASGGSRGEVRLPSPPRPAVATGPRATTTESSRRDTTESFIGYNHTCVDIGQSIARTSQAVLGLLISGRERDWALQMGRHLTSHTYLTLECHAIAAMGMGNTCAAQFISNPEGYRTHMDSWKWYFALSRHPDGSAAYLGSRGNVGGDGYLDFENIMTAVLALSLATPEQNLLVHGKFLPIPGLAVGALSPALQAACGELLSRRVSPALLARLAATAGGKTADAAPAKRILEHVLEDQVRPEVAAAGARLAEGDAREADRSFARIRERYGATALALPAAADLAEKLKTPETRALVELGETYARLAEALDRARKPGSRAFSGPEGPARAEAALRDFAAKHAGTYYARAADLKLRTVPAGT